MPQTHNVRLLISSLILYFPRKITTPSNPATIDSQVHNPPPFTYTYSGLSIKNWSLLGNLLAASKYNEILSSHAFYLGLGDIIV